MTPKSKIKATKAWAWVYPDGKICIASLSIKGAWTSTYFGGKGSIQRVLITAAKAKGGR